MSQDNHHPTYDLIEYREAGIQERPGIIPAWLILVYVVLLVWGIYYLVTYLPSHFAG